MNCQHTPPTKAFFSFSSATFHQTISSCFPCLFLTLFFDHFRAPCSSFFSYFSRSPVSVSSLWIFLVCATIPATCSIPSLTSGKQFLHHRCCCPSRRFLSSFLHKEIIRRIIYLKNSVNRLIVPRVPRLHIAVKKLYPLSSLAQECNPAT